MTRSGNWAGRYKHPHFASYNAICANCQAGSRWRVAHRGPCNYRHHLASRTRFCTSRRGGSG